MEKYTLYAGTKYFGSTVKETITNRDLGFNDDLWNEMPRDEKVAEVKAYFNEWIWDVVDAGWFENTN